MTGRFDALLRRHAPGRGPEGAHRSAEAFCLMWYACPCGHRERFWNSRDGVTPFGTLCPSCGRPDLKHVDWGQDAYAPDFKPTLGQRMWIAMTLERAKEIAANRIAARHKHEDECGEPRTEITQARIDSLVSSFFQDGEAPDLLVCGYQQSAE